MGADLVQHNGTTNLDAGDSTAGGGVPPAGPLRT